MSDTLPAAPGLLQLRLVLAISLDGRLAPPSGGAAQIGGRGDRRVLEEALAWGDAALLGAETLRRHGSTCLIHAPDLLAQRSRQGLSPQPLALVLSRRGLIPAALPFFSQPLERWLLRMPSPEAAAGTAEPLPAGPSDRLDGGFARVLDAPGWQAALGLLAAAGLRRLVVLGGAAVAAGLLAENRIDELQLTLCPRLLGGEHLWLPASPLIPPRAAAGWTLLEHRPLEGDELLLRYGRNAPPV